MRIQYGDFARSTLSSSLDRSDENGFWRAGYGTTGRSVGVVGNRAAVGVGTAVADEKRGPAAVGGAVGEAMDSVVNHRQ